MKCDDDEERRYVMEREKKSWWKPIANSYANQHRKAAITADNINVYSTSFESLKPLKYDFC